MYMSFFNSIEFHPSLLLQAKIGKGILVLEQVILYSISCVMSILDCVSRASLLLHRENSTFWNIISHTLSQIPSPCVFILVLFSLFISLIYCFLSVPPFLLFCFFTYPVSAKNNYFQACSFLLVCSQPYNFCHAAVLFTHFSETMVSIYHTAQFHI